MVFKVQDHYFKRAKNENFLARSVYKLEEIQKKYRVLKPNDHVIDFGCSPGSWIQFIQQVVGSQGEVVGVDLKEVGAPVKNLANVRIYCQDIFQMNDLSQVQASGPFQAVLSDMAPHTTGIRSVDQDRSLNLVEKVFSLLPVFLAPGGHVVVKVFESGNAQEFLREQKKNFGEFHFLRPKSTRSISKEFFVIAKGFRA